MTINHQLLRLAQQKARDAKAQRNGAKWMEANEEMKKAAGMPWYQGRQISAQ
ncbi:host cell division inhibitory peptide Kil [Enterobacter hormaechei]|uniref:host cell division inhibitory peptide Kil n=1 Tax=Enterobacter kobei TaxID=208224 RepID=UPI002FD2B99D